MWAGVEVGFRAGPRGEPELVGQLEQPSTAESFLPVAEVDRLQPGGERANDVDAGQGDVIRRQVSIHHPVTALAQGTNHDFTLSLEVIPGFYEGEVVTGAAVVGAWKWY